MTIRILASCSPGEMRVAVSILGRLIEYGIWRPGRPDGVGDVHRGRVLKAMKGLGGAFVSLPGAIAGSEGFLPHRARLDEGLAINVRVVRAAQGEKGKRLALADDPAEGEPRLLARGPGLLLELAAAYAPAVVEIDDAGAAAALKPLLGERVRLVDAAFSDAVEETVATLGEPELAFVGGVRLRVYPTPALVAIDVDFDGAASGHKAAAQMAANLMILPMMAQQIMLRNLSGAILVDFAGLPARKREALCPRLADVLAGDRLGAKLLGFTQLGLAEIVRPRVHPPLHEMLEGPHAAGLRALRSVDAEARAMPSWSPRLRAAPSVVAALQDDPVALPALAARTGRALVIDSDPALECEGWVIEGLA